MIFITIIVIIIIIIVINIIIVIIVIIVIIIIMMLMLRDNTVQYSLPLHQTHFTSSSSRYGQVYISITITVVVIIDLRNEMIGGGCGQLFGEGSTRINNCQ